MVDYWLRTTDGKDVPYEEAVRAMTEFHSVRGIDPETATDEVTYHFPRAGNVVLQASPDLSRTFVITIPLSLDGRESFVKEKDDQLSIRVIQLNEGRWRLEPVK